MGDRITGLADITGGAKPSPLFYLLADRMAYLMSGDADRILSERTVRLRRRLNGILKFVGPLFLEHRQILESKCCHLDIDFVLIGVIRFLLKDDTVDDFPDCGGSDKVPV